MSSPSVVRAAVPDDERDVWRMFKAHAKENALFSVSERKVQFYIDRILRPQGIDADDGGPRGVIGVIGPVGRLEAATMLVLGSPWYTDEIILEDGMTFVDADHRHTDHVRALISYAKNLVDQTRVAHPNFCLISGVVSTKRTAAKVRLFSRQMEPIGAYFKYPIEQSHVPLKNAHRIN